VDDGEILDAQFELAKEAGIFVEPAAACAWAALRSDSEMLREKFGEEVEVCCLLTGTGFKDMAVFEGKVSIPEAIDNSKEAVRRRFS
jgi:threonine synthase